jgi:hypothetical protein
MTAMSVPACWTFTPGAKRNMIQRVPGIVLSVRLASAAALGED